MQNKIPCLSTELTTGLIAIFSSIATLIVTHCLRFLGKTHVSVESFEKKFLSDDKMGGQIEVKNINDANQAYLYFDLSFWNPSDVNISLRTPKLKIKAKNIKKDQYFNIKVLKTNHIGNLPYDSSYTKLPIINIPSREAIHIRTQIFIEPEDYSFIEGKTTIYLVGKKNKQNRWKSYKIMTHDFSNEI